MRQKARVDNNQAEIVRELRKVPGVSVSVLSCVGRGLPDLLVGMDGKNYLFEVKNLQGRGTALTPDEQLFFAAWHGQVDIVCCVEDALALLEK